MICSGCCLVVVVAVQLTTVVVVVVAVVAVVFVLSILRPFLLHYAGEKRTRLWRLSSFTFGSAGSAAASLPAPRVLREPVALPGLRDASRGHVARSLAPAGGTPRHPRRSGTT
jgi:hypothetical protein